MIARTLLDLHGLLAPVEPSPIREGIAAGIDAVAESVRAAGSAHGIHLDIDAASTIAERSALGGGGSRACRMVPASDEWLAVSLARPDDTAALPAWLESDIDQRDPWPGIMAAVRCKTAASLVERAALLGLPVARHGEVLGRSSSAVVATAGAGIRASEARSQLTVVDLSSLWAGPLCARILRASGLRTIKVESARRRDGGRAFPEFFDALHSGTEFVDLDFTTAVGRRQLAGVIAGADVVIEASRPRALRQLGIDPERLVSSGSVRCWVSITGYGRLGAGADRVGFGDDTAVAGGLVDTSGSRPELFGDAIADPLTGMAAAAAALLALATNRSWMLDVALSRVAGFVAWDAAGPEAAHS